MSYADRILNVKNQVTDKALVKRRRGQIVAAAVALFAEQGFYRTTVQEITARAGVSAGLVYRYVRDKEDLLLLSILDVLDSYATEVPNAMAGIDDPLERCCRAFHAYCEVVDARRAATVLAYRSTKSLPPERRQFVKDAEADTNRLIESCIQDCIDQGVFRPIDATLTTYQLVMFAHAWALKHWCLGRKYTLEDYVAQGLDLFIHAVLTEKGWAHLDACRRERADFPCAVVARTRTA